MHLATSLRTDALLLGAPDHCLSAALLTDAAFAAVLRIDGHGPGPVRIGPGLRASDPALPGCLAAFGREAAGIEPMTPVNWIGHTLGVAAHAIAGELDAWWGTNSAPSAIARQRARTSLEAACAGDGDAEANALALLLWKGGWLDVVRGCPSTAGEDRRLALARLELPAAPAAFVAAGAGSPTPLVLGT